MTISLTRYDVETLRGDAQAAFSGTYRRREIFCLDTLDQTGFFRWSLGHHKWRYSKGLYVSVQGVQGVQGELNT